MKKEFNYVWMLFTEKNFTVLTILSLTKQYHFLWSWQAGVVVLYNKNMLLPIHLLIFLLDLRSAVICTTITAVCTTMVISGSYIFWYKHTYCIISHVAQIHIRSPLNQYCWNRRNTWKITELNISLGKSSTMWSYTDSWFKSVDITKNECAFYVTVFWGFAG